MGHLDKKSELTDDKLREMMKKIREERSDKSLPPLSHRDLMQEAISRLT